MVKLRIKLILSWLDLVIHNLGKVLLEIIMSPIVIIFMLFVSKEQLITLAFKIGLIEFAEDEEENK